MLTALLHVPTEPDSGTPGRARVDVIGEVDLASAPLLREALAAAAGHHGDVIDANLAEVTFFDCAALRTLQYSADAAPGRLRLVAPSAPVRRVLDLFDVQQLAST